MQLGNANAIYNFSRQAFICVSCAHHSYCFTVLLYFTTEFLCITLSIFQDRFALIWIFSFWFFTINLNFQNHQLVVLENLPAVYSCSCYYYALPWKRNWKGRQDVHGIYSYYCLTKMVGHIRGAVQKSQTNVYSVSFPQYTFKPVL